MSLFSLFSHRFVTYANEEGAEKGISMFNETRMKGQTLKVDYTKSFKERRAQNLGMFASFYKKCFILKLVDEY